MEDFDNLDSALFGKSFKKPATSINEIKKKVMFKDFDENNPLRVLNLSDDEDFQESSKEKPTPIVKDNKIADLFGIKSDDKIEEKIPKSTNVSVIDNSSIKKSPAVSNKNSLEKQQTEESELQESNINKSTHNTLASSKENLSQKNTPKMKSIFDDDDFTSNLLEKPKTAPTSQSKKSSLMEDLFGSRPKSSTTTETSKRKNSFNFDVPSSHVNPGESLTGSTSDSTIKALTGFVLSASREPRRSRRTSTVQNDPLGLLSASNLQVEESPKLEEKQTHMKVTETKTTVTEDLPEWLGGPKVHKEQKQEIEKTSQSEVSSSAKSVETLEKISGSTDPPALVSAIDNANQSALTSKLLGIEFDQQSTIINLQQQEYELRTATALSQQNEKLNYLLEMQKLKLNEQEKQFNVLITKQLERQSLLEAQMKSQQERIDNYIQTLTAQPTTIPAMYLSMGKNFNIESKDSIDEKAESESFVQKLQLEKLYLENTLESLKEKHEKEITILEDSYKKQITFLEEAMVKLEKRMQDDIECLEADCKLKIQKLKDEISENESTYKTEKERIKEEHSKLVGEIQERHFQNLEIMQKEHNEIIDRITKSKDSERQAIEIMRIDGINIQNILNKSQVIIENLEDLQKKFETRNINFIESQDSHLLIQEKNVEYLKELLEKQKNEFVEEKQKLMSIIQKLELDTSELVKEFEKQNANFRENEEILKSKEQALLRDREIFVEQTNWERERIQAMRDAWTKEEDKQLEWLFQERQALATERGKIQICNRLKIGIDESSKVELEATIKAAQIAATSANQERLKWQEKINELEIQQNALEEKENRLIQKAKELQDLTQSALAKRDEGLRALKEAYFIEERYKEKLNKLQMQQEILTQRENKLAAEKIELARERLSFRVSETEKPEKDVINNICANSYEEDPSKLSEVPSNTQYKTYFKDIVDPNLVLLKWDLDNKLESSKKVSFSTSH